MMIGRWVSPAPLFLLETPRLPTGLEHETKPSSVLDEALAPWILVLAPEIKLDAIKSLQIRRCWNIGLKKNWLKQLIKGNMLPEVLGVPDWWEEELAVWHLDEVVEDAEAESIKITNDVVIIDSQLILFVLLD